MSRLLERIATAILEGDPEETAKLVKKGLDEGMSANEIMDNGLLVGMSEVGVRFKAGDMFVPEVLMSAEAMQAGTTHDPPAAAQPAARSRPARCCWVRSRATCTTSARTWSP